MHFVNITIFDKVTKEEVFAIRNEYRAFDFQEMTWDSASNDFVVKSGDLGIFYYEYQEKDTWEKRIMRNKFVLQK